MIQFPQKMGSCSLLITCKEEPIHCKLQPWLPADKDRQEQNTTIQSYQLKEKIRPKAVQATCRSHTGDLVHLENKVINYSIDWPKGHDKSAVHLRGVRNNVWICTLSLYFKKLWFLIREKYFVFPFLKNMGLSILPFFRKA